MQLVATVGYESIDTLIKNLRKTNDAIFYDKVSNEIGTFVIDGYSLFLEFCKKRKSYKQITLECEAIIKHIEVGIDKHKQVLKEKKDEDSNIFAEYLDEEMGELEQLELKTTSKDPTLREMQHTFVEAKKTIKETILSLKSSSVIVNEALERADKQIDGTMRKVNKSMTLADLELMETASFKIENIVDDSIHVAVQIIDNIDPSMPGQYSIWSAIRDLYGYIRLRILYLALIRSFEKKEERRVRLATFCMPLMNVPVMACHLGLLLLKIHLEDLKPEQLKVIFKKHDSKQKDQGRDTGGSRSS
jgi:hypothetical protein